MSLTTPLSVQKLQTALHDKATGSPNFRFYALYDKVYREEVMAFAYECCQANGGAAGVDGQTFEDIEEYGVKNWLDELRQELKSRTYRPQPVRRVWIPKPDGKQRPLGVPAIKDRVAQTAAVLVLEPIYEADLQPEQYAYRPDHSALDADHQVIRIIDDVCSKTLLVPELLPSQHESTHVQVAEQRADRGSLWGSPSRIPIARTPMLIPFLVGLLDRSFQPHLD
jgi:RNA-directed DNA polymerase